MHIHTKFTFELVSMGFVCLLFFLIIIFVEGDVKRIKAKQKHKKANARLTVIKRNRYLDGNHFFPVINPIFYRCILHQTS